MAHTEIWPVARSNCLLWLTPQAYQQSTRTLCVCVERNQDEAERSGSGNGEVFNFIRLFNADGDLHRIGSFQLDPFENAMSTCSTSFTGDPLEYFVVGTAYIIDGQEEPESAEKKIAR